MNKKRKIQITLGIIGISLILLIIVYYLILYYQREKIEISKEEKITDECTEERIMDRARDRK